MPTDFLSLFAAISAAQVPYVVVGGLAMLLHGIDRVTGGIDLVIDLASGASNARARRLAIAMNPADRHSIEHFVRTTLGCHCPDEVFQSIVIETAPTSRDALPHTRLVIGNRLLIYIHETQPAKATTAAVSRLAKQGLAERDAKQYNRYRLVITSAHPTQLLTDTRASFESVAGEDQRANLHILATDQLPDALRFDVTAAPAAS